MKRFTILIGAVFLLMCSSMVLWAAMTDSTAAAQVFKLWGSAGAIAMKPRVRSDSNWTRQIGFLSPGCQTDFTVVGEGFNTWDAAFAAMPTDKGIGGTFGGMITLSLQSSSLIPPVPPAADPVFAVIASFQWILDGKPLGSVQVVTQPAPPMLLTPWDTTTVTNGFHVLCAQLKHTDGSFGLSHATLLIVKQGQ